MNIRVFDNAHALGKGAGIAAAALIRNAINARGTANIILATGASQFETINQLIMEKNIDWGKVSMFHLDEYIDLPLTHPASFRKYLGERFLEKLPPLKAAYLINGEENPKKECARIGDIISNHPIDVALVGIGENGHLAFNDPPADFDAEEPYLIVRLDEFCRKQQLGEGWFQSLEEVPVHAISMSTKQILKAAHIICSVPDARKAVAVSNCIQQPISNLYPATILQLHTDCRYYLDIYSAALLSPGMISQINT